MAISKIDTSNTIGSTEYSVAANANYSSGSPQTTQAIVQAFFDLNTLAAGDSYQFRIYESVGSSGTQRVVAEAVIVGVVGTPDLAFPSMILTDAWDVTVKKLAGTDRVIKASVRTAS